MSLAVQGTLGNVCEVCSDVTTHWQQEDTNMPGKITLLCSLNLSLRWHHLTRRVNKPHSCPSMQTQNERGANNSIHQLDLKEQDMLPCKQTQNKDLLPCKREQKGTFRWFQLRTMICSFIQSRSEKSKLKKKVVQQELFYPSHFSLRWKNWTQ